MRKKMKNKLKFIIAYIAIFLSWILFIIAILISFRVIPFDLGTVIFFLIPNIILVNIYDKYKPMDFRNMVLKYTGKKLPIWEIISYKFKVFIGIDPDYLDKKTNDKSSQNSKAKTYEEYKKQK
jgi:hypothetical protein